MFLIVGGDSEIGGAAARVARERGFSIAATTRRRDRVDAAHPFLDLSAPLDDWTAPAGTTAACICAAVARMAACADDPAGTARINVDQTLALIDKLIARGIFVLFLSTNQVFDGRTEHVAAEAAYSPVSEYGRQKMRTEIALRERMARNATIGILRLAKVVSLHMPLLDGWAANLLAGRPISAFSDMVLAPTPTDLVCAAIGALMDDRARGIFQLTGPRDASYAEVGRFIAARLGVAPSLVEETSARAAGLPQGATPANTTLDSRLVCDRYRLDVPDVWQVIENAIPAVAERR